MNDSRQKRRRPWTLSGRAKRMFHLSRILHIYLSTLFFALLIFFCVTGILLNHTDWMSAPAHEGEAKVPLPAAVTADWEGLDWATAEALPPLTRLEQFLRTSYGLTRAKEIKFDREAKEITLDYQMPSAYVFVIVVPEEQRLELEYRRFGFWQVMGDLHKGRHSGSGWSWVIDLSAVAMILFSITGLLLLLQNLKLRRAGLIFTVAGIVLPVLVYYVLVPRFLGV